MILCSVRKYNLVRFLPLVFLQEKECLELRMEKEKNLEQLKVLHSRIEAKDADANLRKDMEM